MKYWCKPTAWCEVDTMVFWLVACVVAGPSAGIAILIFG